jgi:endonuclease/exonuclease/phosphatase family metal-dependent hydrolase
LKFAATGSASDRRHGLIRLVFVIVVVAVLVCGSCAARSGHISGSSLPACRQVVPDPRLIIAWASPPAERDRVKLADWCAAVGPLLFEPKAGDGTTLRAPIADHLAIVTWNMHVGGGDVDDLIGRVRSGEFSSGRRIDHLVLLLQESYRSGGGVPATVARQAGVPGRIALGSHATHARDVGRVAAAHTMAVLYAPSMRNGAAPDDPEDRGNAILSTIPLSDPEVIELPFEHQRRVAVVAGIAGYTAGGRPWRMRLADVHLDTALALGHGGPLQARRRQVEALLDALPGSPVPTVVAGDFNAWLGRREPAINLLQRQFPDAPGVNDPTWIGPAGLRATLDYVFARGEWRGIQVSRLPLRFGSDHFPLLAVIEF